ncbi:MAG: aldehyde ferredoxin oxidoreductase N-terminal domain-containing protein [Clostridia bacterium]|nr:aldehyde ferredoxin oxidoreductase N-terminal domain-containing protein [Clostridia bacterium]
MASVLIADLTAQAVSRAPAPALHYGRGLAVSLLAQHTPAHCPRLSSENAFVIAPGLLTGTPVPCATRASVVARAEGHSGLAVTNITGDLPQKLASLDIAAIVIKGKSALGNAVLYIDAQETRLLHMPKLQGLSCGEIVAALREDMGTDCAILGCGPAADMALPLSGIFTTYPEGTPRFTCPRSSFGDVPGSKGLRAIVIKYDHYFDAPCAHRASLQADGKRLAQRILQDPICGGALPGLGSITILHLLKNGGAIPETPRRAPASRPSAEGPINYCCAPMCAIGCLNRHAGSGGRLFAAPEEAEVRAAVGHCFEGMLSESEMDALSAALSTKGLSLGLNATEFAYTASLYMQLTAASPTPSLILSLMDEVAQGTLTGRLLGGGTAALCRLYPNDEAVQKRLTRPAVQSEKQHAVKLAVISEALRDVDDMERLYRQIFLMENLGLCIFSSFALLNHADTLALLARLYAARTGEDADADKLLSYAGECLEAEEALKTQDALAGAGHSVPEFVKVLYRYFSA